MGKYHLCWNKPIPIYSWYVETLFDRAIGNFMPKVTFHGYGKLLKGTWQFCFRGNRRQWFRETHIQPHWKASGFKVSPTVKCISSQHILTYDSCKMVDDFLRFQHLKWNYSIESIEITGGRLRWFGFVDELKTAPALVTLWKFNVT